MKNIFSIILPTLISFGPLVMILWPEMLITRMIGAFMVITGLMVMSGQITKLEKKIAMIDGNAVPKVKIGDY